MRRVLQTSLCYIDLICTTTTKPLGPANLFHIRPTLGWNVTHRLTEVGSRPDHLSRDLLIIHVPGSWVSG